MSRAVPLTSESVVDDAFEITALIRTYPVEGKVAKIPLLDLRNRVNHNLEIKRR